MAWEGREVTGFGSVLTVNWLGSSSLCLAQPLAGRKVGTRLPLQEQHRAQQPFWKCQRKIDFHFIVLGIFKPRQMGKERSCC